MSSPRVGARGLVLHRRAEAQKTRKQRSDEMLHKVLIIDDAASVHALIRARLSDEPYDIRSAHETETGETMVREFRPDLILLDIDLPGRDCFAFCRGVKEDPC